MNFDGAEDQVFEGADEGGGIADGGHHAEALDAGFFCVDAAIDVDFVEGFDVFGHKGNRDDQQVLLPLSRQSFQRLREGRLEPFPADDSSRG